MTRLFLLLFAFVAALTATEPSASNGGPRDCGSAEAAWSDGAARLSAHLANVATRASIRAPSEPDGRGASIGGMLLVEAVSLDGACVCDTRLASPCARADSRAQTRLHDAIPPPLSV